MKSEWSLSEAARLLRQPQHKLIYLCEKGVIVPDLAKARGRGSSRRFSARNLLEFEIALKLRELTVPANSIAAILYALRAFEAKVARELPGFGLPAGLRSRRAPDLRIMLTDQGRLYFSLGRERGERRVFGGLDFGRLAASREIPRRTSVVRVEASSLAFPAIVGGRLADEIKAQIEVSVTRIARDLDLG
jgi:DNA-binding transcriptional MerR regulator